MLLLLRQPLPMSRFAFSSRFLNQLPYSYSWQRLRFKTRGIDLTPVAITAAYWFRITPISQLRKVLVVNVARHSNHEARRLFDRVFIGREIYMLRLSILFMAVSAWRAQFVLIPMHQLIKVIS
jgi:hypothetical protein